MEWHEKQSKKINKIITANDNLGVVTEPNYKSDWVEIKIIDESNLYNDANNNYSRDESKRKQHYRQKVNVSKEGISTINWKLLANKKEGITTINWNFFDDKKDGLETPEDLNINTKNNNDKSVSYYCCLICEKQYDFINNFFLKGNNLSFHICDSCICKIKSLVLCPLHGYREEYYCDICRTMVCSYCLIVHHWHKEY